MTVHFKFKIFTENGRVGGIFAVSRRVREHIHKVMLPKSGIIVRDPWCYSSLTVNING